MPLAVLALLVEDDAWAAPAWRFSEAISAKVRLFRAPEFLGTAFLLAVLGMLTHFLLEA